MRIVDYFFKIFRIRIQLIMSEKSRTRHVKFLYTQISVRIQTLSKKFTNENIQGNS